MNAQDIDRLLEQYNKEGRPLYATRGKDWVLAVNVDYEPFQVLRSLYDLTFSASTAYMVVDVFSLKTWRIYINNTIDNDVLFPSILDQMKIKAQNIKLSNGILK